MDVHNLAHMEDCVASIRMKIVARVQDPMGATGVGEATVAIMKSRSVIVGKTFSGNF